MRVGEYRPARHISTTWFNKFKKLSHSLCISSDLGVWGRMPRLLLAHQKASCGMFNRIGTGGDEVLSSSSSWSSSFLFWRIKKSCLALKSVVECVLKSRFPWASPRHWLAAHGRDQIGPFLRDVGLPWWATLAWSHPHGLAPLFLNWMAI